MSNLAETLYYQMYNCVLLGDLENARMYLSFLRQEYDDNEDLFVCLKKDERWDHLGELGNIIDSGLLTKRLQIVEKPVEKIVKQHDEAHFKRQKQLVDAICLSKDSLRSCLKADGSFHCSNVEHLTRFGRVDLLAEDKKTIYPIEVKKDLADHEVIGQIDKYILHFKLDLMYKMYTNIKGVIIANSFTQYVLQELYKFGAIAIIYKFKSEKNIELKRA